MKDRHLISADELRASGALYVPPAWRKSLSARLEPDLFSKLIDDEGPRPGDQAPPPGDEDEDDDDDEAGDDLP